MNVVVCVDKTRGKLYFAQDLLWALNNTGIRTCIFKNEKYADDYRFFFPFFENIKWRDCPYTQADYYHVDVIEYADQINPQRLSYPVLNNEEAREYAELRRDDKYKKILSPLKNPDFGNPFFTGDAVWVIDMLKHTVGANDLAGKHFLISAGPTREFFDPVRFLSNRSTGKMGIALARAAFIRGADVTLVLGPTNEYVPEYLNTIRIKSAAEMADAVIDNFENSDVYIGAAAIADFTPEKSERDKIKKSSGDFQPVFKRTTDVLSALKDRKKKQFMVGFSVETKDVEKNSLQKLRSKDLDLIVVNNPNDAGAAFEVDTNKATIINRYGAVEELPLLTKLALSDEIINRVVKLMQN